ncbi:MAG: hypothetical protein JSV00_05640 [bacterium]|nr:MAG: hypothetical protein JSV00_05640 [bacterium]
MRRISGENRLSGPLDGARDPSSEGLRPPFTPIIELALDSGRMIRTDQLHMGCTYGDHPQTHWPPAVLRDMNYRVMKMRNHPAGSLWPEDLPSVLLDMNRYLLRLDRVLPLYKLTALFVSGPIHEDRDRSSVLVVHWLQDAAHPFLSRENDGLIRALDWDGLALGRPSRE